MIRYPIVRLEMENLTADMNGSLGLEALSHTLKYNIYIVHVNLCVATELEGFLKTFFILTVIYSATLAY